jgi:hypothetical protein
MQTNVTWHMKHSTAGSMLCSERIAGTPVAVYFIFAGESLGWVWLPRICLKSTGHMVFHLILLRSNYSAFLRSLRNFSTWPTLFLDELCLDWHVSSGSEGDLTAQTRPSRQVAPTAKLTDTNNTEQPRLTFQRKAVKAFHSRRAQETEATSLANNPSIQSIPALSSNNTTPTIPLQTHLSTVTNRDTNSNQHVEDEDSDDQPKPHKSLIFTSQIVN